jgi:uncharacterized protein
MPIAVILRRLLLITLLILPQVYWLGRAWRLAGRPAFGLAGRAAVRGSIIAAVAAIAAVLFDEIAIRFLPAALSYSIAPIVQLWIFSSTTAYFLTKALHAIAWCSQKITGLFRPRAAHQATDPSRRAVLYQLASIAGATPFAVALYGYSFERFRFQIEPVDIPVAGLPPALDGLRIVQLSDIHVGDFMPLHEVRRAVGMANELAPELAVITGDFLSSRGDPLAECIGELAHLRASLGIWGCNGNHEIYAGAEDDAEALFTAKGMRLLRQSAAQLTRNGASLNLIGIDYPRTVFTSGPVATLNGAESLVRRDMPNILLSHDPNTFYRAAEAGVELSLAGHTHGGQVNMEILNTALNPARSFTAFIAGLYHLPMASSNATATRSSLYVNRGLGTLGIPARIGSNPEITLLTLRKA